MQDSLRKKVYPKETKHALRDMDLVLIMVLDTC
jgi:hypothetical protein